MALTPSIASACDSALSEYRKQVVSNSAAAAVTHVAPIALFDWFLNLDAAADGVRASAAGDRNLLDSLQAKRDRAKTDEELLSVIRSCETELKRPGLWSTTFQLSPIGAAYEVMRDTAKDLTSPSRWPWWLWLIVAGVALFLVRPFIPQRRAP
jgi:hypothetical protein